MDDPVWITKETVLILHDRQLAVHGGQEGIRDPGLLESALNRPRHLFAYTDPTPALSVLAAAYAFGIARNLRFWMKINAPQQSPANSFSGVMATG